MAQALERIHWFMFRHEITRGTDPGEVVASAGGTTTTTIMATMTGGVDEWKGYYLGCITATNAANVGEAVKITGFALGPPVTFTHEAFPADTTAADTFEVFGFCPGTADPPHYSYERLSRDDYQRVTFDPPASIQGKTISEMSASLEAYGIDQVGTEQDPLHHLLTGGIGPQLTAPSTSAVVAGGSATELRVTDPHGPNFAVGQAVAVADIIYSGALTRDEVRYITAIDNTPGGHDALTVSPAFSATPTTGKAVKGAATYVPAETGHRSYTVVVQVHQQRWKFTGCDIRITGLSDWTAGQLPMLGMEMKADDQTTPAVSSTVFGPENPTKNPPTLLTGTVNDGTTALSCPTMSVDFGWTVNDQLAAGGRVQFRVVDRKSTGSVTVWNEAIAVPTALDADTTIALLMYGGTIATGMVGFYAVNAKPTDLNNAATDGMMTYERPIEFFDPATDAGDSTKPIFFRL